MRDEMDARLWNQNHEAFSKDLGAALDKAGARARRLNRGVPTPLKVMVAVLAASVAALSSPAPAFAQQVVEAPFASIAVPYGDLDIASEPGRRTLAARVRGAASHLCQPDIFASLEERAARRACYRTAIADADAQISRALAARPGGTREIAVAAR